MTRLELETLPVIGEDGWEPLEGEINFPDEQAIQVMTSEGNVQSGHAIEFKNSNCIRGYLILGYKLV